MKKLLDKTDEFVQDSLKLLNPLKVEFTNTNSGFLDFSYEGESYEQVSLIRLIPFRETDKYISVSYRDNDKEWHEIGVIEDINTLPEKQLEIVQSYLDYRYYIPVITKVFSITDNRMGYLFIDAETTAGRKRISVNDWWSNFKLNTHNVLNVVDADGNRYRIHDMEKMDRRSIKKLQLFI